jgi:hypothetical protein
MHRCTYMQWCTGSRSRGTHWCTGSRSRGTRRPHTQHRVIKIPTNSVQHKPSGEAASRSVQPVLRFSWTPELATDPDRLSRTPLPPPKFCFFKVHSNLLQQPMRRSSERSLQVFQSNPHTNLTSFLPAIHVPPILYHPNTQQTTGCGRNSEAF